MFFVDLLISRGGRMFSDLPISASSLIDVDGVRSGEGRFRRDRRSGRTGGGEGIRRRGTRRLRTPFVERVPGGPESAIDVDGVRSVDVFACRHGAFVAPTHAIEEAVGASHIGTLKRPSPLRSTNSENIRPPRDSRDKKVHKKQTSIPPCSSRSQRGKVHERVPTEIRHFLNFVG